MIVDVVVTTGAKRESQIYLDRISDMKKKYDFKEVIADRGYGSGEILTELKKQNIKSFIPLYAGAVNG